MDRVVLDVVDDGGVVGVDTGSFDVVVILLDGFDVPAIVSSW